MTFFSDMIDGYQNVCRSFRKIVIGSVNNEDHDISKERAEAVRLYVVCYSPRQLEVITVLFISPSFANFLLLF